MTKSNCYELAGIALLLAGIAGCGSADASENTTGSGGAPGSAGSAGASGSATSGGTPPTAGQSGGGGELMIQGGGGATATIPIQVPENVELELCKEVTDADAAKSNSDCFLCCAPAGFKLHGFLEHKCACGNSPGADEVCNAPAPATGAACTECCKAASFLGGLLNPGPPASCSCDSRTDDNICRLQTGANCEVCCFNAGYLKHSASGNCRCYEG